MTDKRTNDQPPMPTSQSSMWVRQKTTTICSPLYVVTCHLFVRAWRRCVSIKVHTMWPHCDISIIRHHATH